MENKKGLVAGGLGLLAAGLVALLLKKDYDRHLEKLSSPKEEDPTPKKTEESKVDEEVEAETEETPIISKVVKCFYEKAIVDDDVLESYDKVVDRPLGSNQIELHILEGNHCNERFLEVLVRVPENRTYSNFHRSITAAIKNFWEKYPNEADRIKGDFQLPIFTKVGEKVDDEILLDYVPTTEWEMCSTKDNHWEKYKDGMPKMIQNLRKQQSFEEGECSIESYCGFQFLLTNGGTSEEIELFCDFMKEFFDEDFIEITVGNNLYYQANVRIDILAFHAVRKLDEICEIDRGEIVGTTHTILNEQDAKNFLFDDEEEEEEDGDNE